jgi:hypothetical protein
MGDFPPGNLGISRVKNGWATPLCVAQISANSYFDEYYSEDTAGPCSKIAPDNPSPENVVAEKSTS